MQIGFRPAKEGNNCFFYLKSSYLRKLSVRWAGVVPQPVWCVLVCDSGGSTELEECITVLPPPESPPPSLPPSPPPSPHSHPPPFPPSFCKAAQRPIRGPLH